MPRLAPRSPVTKTILELLADGDWHPRVDVIETAARVVPPGVAYRNGERHRAWIAARRGYRHDGRKHGDDATAIAAGAGIRARDLLRQLIRGGHVERALVDGVDSLRLIRSGR